MHLDELQVVVDNELALVGDMGSELALHEDEDHL